MLAHSHREGPVPRTHQPLLPFSGMAHYGSCSPGTKQVSLLSNPAPALRQFISPASVSKAWLPVGHIKVRPCQAKPCQGKLFRTIQVEIILLFTRALWTPAPANRVGVKQSQRSALADSSRFSCVTFKLLPQPLCALLTDTFLGMSYQHSDNADMFNNSW